ncbi:MAG: hypothetical protein RIC12_00820 [Pirellulales bacterium]
MRSLSPFLVLALTTGLAVVFWLTEPPNVAKSGEPSVVRPSPGTTVHELNLASSQDFNHRLTFDRAQIEYASGQYRLCLLLLSDLDDDLAVHYLRGLCYLGLNEPVAALPELQKVTEAPFAPDEAILDLALAQLALGQFDQALESTETFLARSPEDPLGLHLQQIAVQQRNERSEQDHQGPEVESTARNLVSYQVEELPGTPPTEVYAPLSDYLDPTFRSVGSQFGNDAFRGSLGNLGVNPNRHWNLSLLTAYEYDSNVPLAPSFIGLGSDFRKEDSRWVTAAFGEYRLVQEPDWTIGLLGSAFANFHFELDDFNLQNYSGGAYVNRAIGPGLVSFYYQFFERLLGGDEIGQEHRLTPSATWLFGEFGHVTGYYEYSTADVQGPVLIPALIRDAQVHSVGVTQATYLFGGQGRLFFGYRFDEAFAVGDDFDRRTQQANIRLEAPLFSPKILADVDVRQFWDDYLDPNSLDFYGRPRSDSRTEVRVGLQWYFTRHWSYRLDYTFVNNDSNVTNLFDVQFYEYDRHIVSSQLIYDF